MSSQNNSQMEFEILVKKEVSLWLPKGKSNDKSVSLAAGTEGMISLSLFSIEAGTSVNSSYIWKYWNF